MKRKILLGLVVSVFVLLFIYGLEAFVDRNKIQNVSNSSIANQTSTNTYSIDNKSTTLNEPVLNMFSVFNANSCYDYTMYGKDKNEQLLLICRGDIDDIILKYKKSIPFAIYKEIYALNLIKVEKNFNYTITANFYSDLTTQYKVSSSPSYLNLNYTSPNFELFEFDVSDEPEVNGEFYYTYIRDHSVTFSDSTSLYYRIDYRLIEAEKGDAFSISGYEGVRWVTYNYIADTPFCLIDNYSQKRLPVEKTKNGYFTADLSSLESGVYFVKEYNCLIELCD